MTRNSWGRMIAISPDSADSDELVISAAVSVLAERGKALSPETREAVYRARCALRPRDRPELRGTTLELLVGSPDGGSYVEQVATTYREGLPGVSEWTLAAAAARDTAGTISPVLFTAVANDKSRSNALLALAYAPEAGVQAIGDRAVRAYLETEGPQTTI